MSLLNRREFSGLCYSHIQEWTSAVTLLKNPPYRIDSVTMHNA